MIAVASRASQTLDRGISASRDRARAPPHHCRQELGALRADFAHQNNGHGDALMRYALERCDRDTLPAYLESTNPRNVSLYRRQGFEEVGTIQVGTSPTLVPMLRRPR